jgi:hypothetical protein
MDSRGKWSKKDPAMSLSVTQMREHNAMGEAGVGKTN